MADPREHDASRELDLQQEMGVVLWEADPRTLQMTYVSPGIETLLGYPASQWLQTPGFLHSLIHRDYADPARFLSDISLAAGRGWEDQYPVARADGSYLWVRNRVRVSLGSDGRPTCLSGMLLDESHHHRQDQGLGQALAGLGCLIWTATVRLTNGEYLWDTRILNEEAARALMPVPMAPGQPYAEALYVSRHESDRERTNRRGLEALQRGEDGYSQRYRYHRADGQVRWVAEEASVRQEGEGAWRLSGVCMDVTELRRAERESRLIAANAQCVIWYGDVRQDEKGSFQWQVSFPDDDVAAHVLQIDPIPGVPIADVWWRTKLPEDRVRMRETADAAFREGKGSYTQEFRYTRASGEVRWLLEQVSIKATGPGLWQAVGVDLDITERKHLEEALYQSQKLEAIGRLAGGIAHDFNNLLTAVLGHADLILMRTGAGDPRRSSAEEVKRAAERAAALTQQLLAYGRRQVLEPQVLNLNAFVSGREVRLKGLLGSRVDLLFRLDESLPLVLADPRQMEQVLLHLLTNARDAMPAGGTVTVETQSLEDLPEALRESADVPPGAYAALSVSDTGRGMDEETLRQAFDPFFTSKMMGKGAGLGLATVFGILKQSGGGIVAWSSPGQGSTFQVLLPRHADPPELHGIPARRSEGVAGTILLVEDEEVVRGLLSHLLESAGYTVLAAADRDGALDLCSAYGDPIHLMVTDVVMPGMSMLELTSYLRDTRPEMRVLYISGHGPDVIQRHGVPRDSACFLQKPFRPAALYKKVEEALLTQPLN
ncbi:MAG TPA: PAS domain-containing protein [Armatimonadota bacterium]